MERTEIPYGFIEGNKIYLDLNGNGTARPIGDVKNSPEESVRYFQDRFVQFSDKVKELEAHIEEAENKGSFLMKLLHLKTTVHNHDGLGDYSPLVQKLEQLESFLNEVIAKNRIRNTDIKRALLEEAEEAKNIADWKEATDKLLDVKSRWLRTGNTVEELNNAYEEQFRHILDVFFAKKKDFFEEKQKLVEQRIEKYKALIQEVDKATFISAFEAKKLHDRWKEVGKVPVAKFKDILNEFTRKIKAKNRAARPLQQTESPEQQEKNFEAKRQLLARLNTIDIDKSTDAIKTIKDIKESWKKIGLVPREKYRAQQEEFNISADLLTEKYFLEKMAASKDANYATKNSREKIRIKMRLLKDLLARDEKELQTFYDNMHHVNTRQGDVNKLLDQKLSMQKHKVQVKKTLLRSFKQSLDTF